VVLANVTGGDAPAASAPPAAAEAVSELQGIGCSAGRVRGRARVVRSPEQHLNINGEILVAPMTDPGWVFLMVPARGLIVERGSILSHTAIIGRELGIPTVVGVPDATSIITDGQMLELDGAAGTIRILS
jgi:pyruvate,water dikinase